MSEIQRLIRHGVAPLVAWAVSKGLLPEFMQHDVTEFLVLAVAIGGPFVWSWYRDQRK